MAEEPELNWRQRVVRQRHELKRLKRAHDKLLLERDEARERVRQLNQISKDCQACARETQRILQIKLDEALAQIPKVPPYRPLGR